MLEFSFVNAKEKESHKECNKKSLTSDFYINQVILIYIIYIVFTYTSIQPDPVSGSSTNFVTLY